MALKSQYTPIYRHFVKLIFSGYSLLDENSQTEIRMFISACQNSNGGFNDRGKNSDLYYTMFGFWMSMAIDLNSSIEKLKSFISKQNNKKQKGINAYALKLIQLETHPEKKPRFGFEDFFKRDQTMNFSYRIFILLLLFDTRYGHKSWLNFIVKMGLSFYRIKKDIPCSMLAALLVARHKVGLSIETQKNLLFEYFNINGFKSLKQAPTTDMLSTAVALFALWYADVDLRIIAPPCFEFIEENFDGGAFLSGDGDQTRDLEYTFYGLMALGALAQNQK